MSLRDVDIQMTKEEQDWFESWFLIAHPKMQSHRYGYYKLLAAFKAGSDYRISRMNTQAGSPVSYGPSTGG